MRLTLLFVCAWSLPGAAQNISYVSGIVDTLASPYFSGRGYVNDGSNRAGNYVASQFDSLCLEPLKGGYFQEFSFRVNTFPTQTVVGCGEDTLEPGRDYLIWPGSGSSSGTFALQELDSSHFQDSSLPKLRASKAAYIDLAGIDHPDEQAQLYSFIQKEAQDVPVFLRGQAKLTWSVDVQRYGASVVELAPGTSCQAPEKMLIDVQAEEISYTARNVVGKISGKSSDSCIAITAHYDHLGMMGAALFAGASDNASGVATMLNLASYFCAHPPQYDLYFIAFAAEEAGLLGSRYFVEHPTFDLRKLKLLINLDLMGSAAKGITVVNGRTYEEWMGTLGGINNRNNLLPAIKLRGKAANSDHYWFSEMGYPAIFIYTEGSIKAYHDIYDRPEVVDWANYPQLFTLLTRFIQAL